MNKDELKDAIRESFPNPPLLNTLIRLWFIITEFGHALVNIPRETLRAMGAPDAKPGVRNWADWLANIVAAAFLVFVVWFIRCW